MSQPDLIERVLMQYEEITREEWLKVAKWTKYNRFYKWFLGMTVGSVEEVYQWAYKKHTEAIVALAQYRAEREERTHAK